MKPQIQTRKIVEEKITLALLKLMGNEKTRPLVTQVLRIYQKGIQNLSRLPESTLKKIGIVTPKEYKRLVERIQQLEKEIDTLLSSP
jgi:hypothetical protein